MSRYTFFALILCMTQCNISNTGLYCRAHCTGPLYNMGWEMISWSSVAKLPTWHKAWAHFQKYGFCFGAYRETNAAVSPIWKWKSKILFLVFAHSASLVPRPLPAFQCCTLNRERAWYATAHEWCFTSNRPGIDFIVSGYVLRFVAYLSTFCCFPEFFISQR